MTAHPFSKWIHLAQKIPGLFSKPAMCKYPTTVNKSEIYFLLPKPYSLMWHLVCVNCVRNGRDRKPETRRMHSPKVATFQNSYGQCAVQYRALWNQWWNRWWAQCLGAAETACRIRVLCADSMNTSRVRLRGSITVFSKVQVLVNEFCLFGAFHHCQILHDFHIWGVTFKSKALATKCIFQNYSQLDIYTRLVLKTAKEFFVPSVVYGKIAWSDAWQHHFKWR